MHTFVYRWLRVDVAYICTLEATVIPWSPHSVTAFWTKNAKSSTFGVSKCKLQNEKVTPSIFLMSSHIATRVCLPVCKLCPQTAGRTAEAGVRRRDAWNAEARERPSPAARICNHGNLDVGCWGSAAKWHYYIFWSIIKFRAQMHPWSTTINFATRQKDGTHKVRIKNGCPFSKRLQSQKHDFCCNLKRSSRTAGGKCATLARWTLHRKDCTEFHDTIWVGVCTAWGDMPRYRINSRSHGFILYSTSPSES